METKYTTLIERYFDQQLSAEELAEVKGLKKTDVDFQKEFELFEKTHQAVKLSTIIDLKTKIKSIDRNAGSSKGPLIFTLQRIGVAASILLFIGVGLGFYVQQFSNQNLYDKSYTRVGDYVTNMDNDISPMEQAMDMFDLRQFDNASEEFDEIYSVTGDQVALFYSGHSHYQAGRLEKAISMLNKVSNDYQAESQWYIALAYLKMEDISNTRKTLHKIITDDQDEAFVLKAQKLQDQLSSPFRKLLF